VKFTSISYDEDGTIINYTWNFGNGNYAYDENITYSYEDNGTYTVSLTVTDNDEAEKELIKEIVIKNVAPKALFSVNTEKPRQDEKVVFNATESYDLDGSIVEHAWDFESDGIIDDYGVTVEHRFKDKNDFITTLTVIDNDETEDSNQILISVREKEKIPGFELLIIVMASAMLIFMKKYRKGIWKM